MRVFRPIKRARRACYLIPVLFGIALLIFFIQAPAALCQTAGPAKIAIIVSSKIQPYLDAVEGIKEIIAEKSDVSLDLVIPEEMDEKRSAALAARLSSCEFKAFIAVGPEATLFLWGNVERPCNAIRTFTMVLNPAGLVPGMDLLCGVSLNMPVNEQINQIFRTLPELKRIGILYDPKHNQTFFEQASKDAAERRIGLLPIPVDSPAQIPSVLNGVWKSIGALWLIPDQTVISESLVQFIIKEAISNGVVVIGYNRFFLKSGAGMAMVVDYRGIGKQTAFLLLERLAGSACRMQQPDIQPILNQGILNRLGIRFDDPIPPMARE
jgi:putative ABC transport system substrate-binding protein